MAQIIDFQTFRGARPQRETMPTGTAEILFFLGVRYERMSDVAPEAPAPMDGPVRGGRKPRKRRA